jgi:hypothetical protein
LSNSSFTTDRAASCCAFSSSISASMRGFESASADASADWSSAMRSAPRRPCCESISVLSSARRRASSGVSKSGFHGSAISPLK